MTVDVTETFTNRYMCRTSGRWDAPFKPMVRHLKGVPDSPKLCRSVLFYGTRCLHLPLLFKCDPGNRLEVLCVRSGDDLHFHTTEKQHSVMVAGSYSVCTE